MSNLNTEDKRQTYKYLNAPTGHKMLDRVVAEMYDAWDEIDRLREELISCENALNYGG